jgi:hypothetical protein
MAVDAAFRALRDELARLRELVKALRKEFRRSRCPDRRHAVPTRLYDTGPEIRGLLRNAAAAAKLGLTAAEVDGGGAVTRAALERCEQCLGRVRRHLKIHASDLRDLKARTDSSSPERVAWARWAAKKMERPLQAALRQVGRASEAASACWRELAACPTAAGITITNVAVGTVRAGDSVVRRDRTVKPGHLRPPDPRTDGRTST